MITSTRERASSAVSSAGALAVDVDVDVAPERRPRLDEAVAEAGPALLDPVERLVDGGRVHVEEARQAGEERRQRPGEMELGHGP